VTRVVVPYTNLRQETVDAVQAAGICAEFVRLVDDTHYSRLLLELWAAGETFVVIEHDVAPRPGDLQHLLRCPRPWCGFAYNISTQYAACLGFTKFRGDFIRKYPAVMELAAADERDGMKAGVWVRMDVRLDNRLHPAGETIHTHWPPVPHYNERQVITAELDRGWCHWPPRREV